MFPCSPGKNPLFIPLAGEAFSWQPRSQHGQGALHGVPNWASCVFTSTIHHTKGLAKYEALTLSHKPPVQLPRFPWAAATVTSHYVSCPLERSLSVTAWQVSKGTASEWWGLRKSGVHRCNWLSAWQIACFICKGGRRGGGSWDLGALQQNGTACGHGAGRPGRAVAPAEGRGSQQSPESCWSPQPCSCPLVLSRDHGVTEWERTSRCLCPPFSLQMRQQRHWRVTYPLEASCLVIPGARGETQVLGLLSQSSFYCFYSLQTQKKQLSRMNQYRMSLGEWGVGSGLHI